MFKLNYSMSITQLVVCLIAVFPVCLGKWRLDRIGCYRDSRSDRDLPGLLARFRDNTPVKCTLYCGYHGFSYAGVEKGYKCHCGNSYGKHGRLSDNECNMRCYGSRDYTCGGRLALEIYRKEVIG